MWPKGRPGRVPDTEERRRIAAKLRGVRRSENTKLRQQRAFETSPHKVLMIHRPQPVIWIKRHRSA